MGTGSKNGKEGAVSDIFDNRGLPYTRQPIQLGEVRPGTAIPTGIPVADDTLLAPNASIPVADAKPYEIQAPLSTFGHWYGDGLATEVAAPAKAPQGQILFNGGLKNLAEAALKPARQAMRVLPDNSMEFSFQKEGAPSNMEKMAGQVDPTRAKKFDGLKFVLQDVEGPELFDEGDGKKSRYGMGVGNSEGEVPGPGEIDKAVKIFNDKYEDDTYKSLQDEYDKAAYANLLLHRPAWAKDFIKNYKGDIGGPEFRTALLDYQAEKYGEKPSKKYQQSWLDRVQKVRDVLPK